MSKYLYILDVAHGKDVAGKCSPDGVHHEWIWSREFCKKLAEKLTDLKIDNMIPVASDNEPGLLNRVKLYNSLPVKNKIMISVHNNAASNGQWANARGFEIWTTKGQTTSDKLADIFANSIKKSFPLLPFRADVSDGDLDKECNFTVLMTQCPAMLIENLFQDNKQDVALLQDEAFNEALVDSYVEAIQTIENLM